MATHTQTYMTCDGCDAVFVCEDGLPVFAEDEDELRDLAQDQGWSLAELPTQKEYCANCAPRFKEED